MLKGMREPVNGLTHFGAALAALAGLVVLLRLSGDDPLKQRSLLVYGASLVLMFSASAAYHLIPGPARRLQLLRKVDHAAIYVLIAGTYTPLAANQFSGFWRWGLMSVIWGLALLGILAKVFWINAPRGLSAGIYLGMGWFALLAIGEMLRVLPLGALAWLLAGGLAYTLGAVVYITKRLDFVPGAFGFHEVWHLFVMLGALCHFILILLYVAPTA